MAPHASPSLHSCWHVCLLAVALARQCQATAGSEPRATRSESAFAGAEMYTEAKNLHVNSPEGGAVILNGVVVVADMGALNASLARCTAGLADAAERDAAMEARIDTQKQANERQAAKMTEQAKELAEQRRINKEQAAALVNHTRDSTAQAEELAEQRRINAEQADALANRTRESATTRTKLAGVEAAVAKMAGLLDAVARNVTSNAEAKAKAEAEAAASQVGGDVAEVAEITMSGGLLSPADIESFLDRVVKVAGAASFGGNVGSYSGALTMAKLQDVGNYLTLYNLGHVTSITFDSLVRVGGYLQIRDSPQLESIVFKALTTIDGYLNVYSCPKLKSLSLPKLSTTGSHFSVYGNALLTSLSAPVITSIASSTLDLRANGPSGSLAIGPSCAKLKDACGTGCKIYSAKCTA